MHVDVTSIRSYLHVDAPLKIDLTCTLMLHLRSYLRVDATQQKMLQKTASMKKPACVMSPKKTIGKIVGGDNASKAEFSRLKRSLQRVSKVGRMTPSKSHIIPLAKQKHLDSSGLDTILKAMAFYPHDAIPKNWERVR